MELTHPVPPEVSASIFWLGGQFLGAIFIIVMDALRDDNGDPPLNMTRALIFEAVFALFAVPWIFLIKWTEGRLSVDINARYR